MTNDRIEICVPVAVQLSVRFHIEPGETLTAEAINSAVNELSARASNDVFQAIGLTVDFSMNVLGVERDGKAEFYDGEKDWSLPMPDGVDFTPDPSPAPSEAMAANSGQTIHIFTHEFSESIESPHVEAFANIEDARKAMINAAFERAEQCGTEGETHVTTEMDGDAVSLDNIPGDCDSLNIQWNDEGAVDCFRLETITIS